MCPVAAGSERTWAPSTVTRYEGPPSATTSHEPSSRSSNSSMVGPPPIQPVQAEGKCSLDECLAPIAQARGPGPSPCTSTSVSLHQRQPLERKGTEVGVVARFGDHGVRSRDPSIDATSAMQDLAVCWPGTDDVRWDSPSSGTNVTRRSPLATLGVVRGRSSLLGVRRHPLECDRPVPQMTRDGEAAPTGEERRCGQPAGVPTPQSLDDLGGPARHCCGHGEAPQTE